MPPASKAEWCTVGIASGVKKARSTWRITSVAITRLTPSRAASIAASVDLPTPVVPPISDHQRPVEPVEAPPARGSGPAAVSPSSASSTSSASACRAATSISPSPRSASLALDQPGQLEGALLARAPVADSACAISPFE